MRFRITILFLLFFFKNVGQTIRVSGDKQGKTTIITPSYNKKVHAQFIYYGSEIDPNSNMFAVKIKKIGFTFDEPVTKADFDKDKTWEVRLATTTDLEYQPSSSWRSPLPADFLTGTPLFDGDVTLLADMKTIEVTLSNPFSYDTSKNLIVDIIQKSDGYTYGRTALSGFNTTNNSPKRGVYASADWRGNIPSKPKNRISGIPNITLEIVQDIPYTVNGFKLVQKNAGKNINIGSEKVEIIALNTIISGSLNSKKKITSLKYNTTGTDNPNDLKDFKLFYGATSDLNLATQIQGVVFQPDGTITAIDKELSSGNNFLFITANVTNDGYASGRKIDAIIEAVTVSNVTYNSSTSTAIEGDVSGNITISVDPIIVKDQGGICGTTTSSDVSLAKYRDPSYYDYFNSWSTLLYTPSELGSTPKKITKIGFYVDCKTSACSFPKAKKQKIYMKLVSSNPIASDNIVHPESTCLNGYTEVFSGDVTWNAPTSSLPSVITLDTEFEYNGVQNLLVYYKNEHGGKLGSGWGSCNGSPSFVYASGKFPKSTKRSIGGALYVDGTRKKDDIDTGFLPVTYLEYKPTVLLSVPPNIKKMPVNASICDVEKEYKLNLCDLDIENETSVKWTKSANASGVLKHDTSLNVTYIPASSDRGKVITFTLKIANDLGTDEKSFDVKFYKRPSAKIKRVK